MAAPSGDTYIYAPLTSTDEFRLVFLHRSSADPSGGDFISIEFLPARFDQACSYAALSYAWGEDPAVECIQVYGARPRTLKITKSLASALRSLRTSKHTVLWIDALCIDQNNLREKNHQVGRMAEIYRRASEVVIWLGEAANDSGLAIQFMGNISAKEIDKLAADPRSAKAWVALADLMRRSWFRRRWVVQEVAFARHAVLYCGSAIVSWTRFCEAVELFTEKLNEISQSVLDSAPKPPSSSLFKDRVARYAAGSTMFMFPLMHIIFPPLSTLAMVWEIRKIKAAMILEFDHSSIGELRGVGVHSLIVVYDRVLSRERNDDEPRRLCTMEALLSYLPEFEATDGRDVVFALASLAKDYVGFTPDYEQSVFQVYKNVVQQAVVTSGSLNIICRPWAKPLTNLPSWILSRSALPFKQNNQGIYIRWHADTLVCLPHQRIYSASGSIRASASFKDDDPHFVLTCKGFQIPAIAWIGDQAMEGCVPDMWHKSLTGLGMEQIYLKEMYWRTLVTNRDAKGNPPPRWYSLAYDDAYQLSTDGGLNTMKLLQERKEHDEHISSKLEEFLRRIQAVTWNRQLVRLEDGSLGLVPERTTEHDRICILFGCDVPVVLRRLGENLWEFIGEAFVYGVMDGEAMDRPYKVISFDLV